MPRSAALPLVGEYSVEVRKIVDFAVLQPLEYLADRIAEALLAQLDHHGKTGELGHRRFGRISPRPAGMTDEHFADVAPKPEQRLANLFGGTTVLPHSLDDVVHGLEATDRVI